MPAVFSVVTVRVHIFASCSNTRSKSLSKWQDCLINELLWQIIPYQ